jgi:hypothetical protein
MTNKTQEEIQAERKKYYEENKDRIKAYNKEYTEKNKKKLIRERRNTETIINYKFKRNLKKV